ncbi:pseudouridine synthase [Roseicyclus marinus]|uniref:pseudouridine synthase n=1 Tax=Roseicyclus marinus TaxID=2161673 RepID=UPI00360C87B3
MPRDPAFRFACQTAMRADMSDPERIAKRLSRAGIASRREAERMIAEGRVTVNGSIIDSPALNVTERDQITVDGKPVAEAERPRLWLYHKPTGLVTTAKDEKGRETVFDKLPEDMPRVMSVGRLDLNSEGLLLLTNDGGIKRKLELPATGWLRKYRVRVKGAPTEATLEPLRKGLVIEGERFQGMEATLDRQQGANAWLTIGLREGKNREIRRAMAEIGLEVNRLIRISYGPFRLGTLKPGEVEEIKPRVLRDQLGIEAAVEGHAVAKDKPKRPPVRKKSTPRPLDRPGRPSRR